MSDTNQKFVIAASLIIVLLILAFVYPTRYRYEKLRQESGRDVLIRTDRFTDSTQTNLGRGWFPKQSPPEPFHIFKETAGAPPDPFAHIFKETAPPTLPADFFSKPTPPAASTAKQ